MNLMKLIFKKKQMKKNELMKISRKFDTLIESHPFDEIDFNFSNPFAHEILTTGIQIL